MHTYTVHIHIHSTHTQDSIPPPHYIERERASATMMHVVERGGCRRERGALVSVDLHDSTIDHCYTVSNSSRSIEASRSRTHTQTSHTPTQPFWLQHSTYVSLTTDASARYRGESLPRTTRASPSNAIAHTCITVVRQCQQRGLSSRQRAAVWSSSTPPPGPSGCAQEAARPWWTSCRPGGLACRTGSDPGAGKSRPPSPRSD
mmetsp:Transcript_35613/g.117188  ORF Transcript_35613/g.117188 Transcript_35613/m.117188 type:complete len:203 (+) Transcript_35613:1650-2258(+)